VGIIVWLQRCGTRAREKLTQQSTNMLPTVFFFSFSFSFSFLDRTYLVIFTCKL
jgi:hypothetical protein